MKVFKHDFIYPYQQYILFWCKTVSKMSIQFRLLPKAAKIEVAAKFYCLQPCNPTSPGVQFGCVSVNLVSKSRNLTLMPIRLNAYEKLIL
jgi:hypothetical protein